LLHSGIEPTIYRTREHLYPPPAGVLGSSQDRTLGTVTNTQPLLRMWSPRIVLLAYHLLFSFIVYVDLMLCCIWILFKIKTFDLDKYIIDIWDQ